MAEDLFDLGLIHHVTVFEHVFKDGYYTTPLMWKKGLEVNDARRDMQYTYYSIREREKEGVL